MHARSLSRARRAASVRRLGRAIFLLAVLGCGGDVVTTQPLTDGSHLFWSLTLDKHAINLSTTAPYDTTRVTATPRTSSGAVLTDAPAPRYISGDPERLRVDSDGVLHALGAGTAIPVIARTSVGNLTHVDTALVDITADSAPPALGSFTLHPIAPDSAVWEANELENFTFYGPRTLAAHDSTGTPISGLEIYYASSDTTIATIDRRTGTLSGKRPGEVTITASTTAYGVTRADTLPFTITMPAFMFVMTAPPPPPMTGTMAFGPATVTIAAGGTVLFMNGNRVPIEITFDDTTNVAEDHAFCWCGAGDIPSFGGDTVNWFNDMRGRSFPVAGTYTFHTSAGGGATGTVIVEPPPAGSARRVRFDAAIEGTR